MGVFSNQVSRDEIKAGDHIYSWRNCYLYSHHGIYAGEGKVIHFTRGPGLEVGTGTILDRVIFSSSGSSDSSRPPCPICGDQYGLSGVISSCLDCFLWDGKLYRFEYDVSAAFFLAKARGGTCTLAPSDPPEDVLDRTSFLLEKGFGSYNIFKNNCEDFAVYCKTGLLVVTNISVGRSGQMSTILAAVSAVVPSSLRFLTTSAVVPSSLRFLTTSAVVPSSLRFLTTSAVVPFTAVRCGMYCVSRLVSDIGVRRDVRKIPVERLVDLGNVDPAVESVILATVPCALDLPAETATFKKAPVKVSQLAKAADCKED